MSGQGPYIFLSRSDDPHSPPSQSSINPQSGGRLDFANSQVSQAGWAGLEFMEGASGSILQSSMSEVGDCAITTWEGAVVDMDDETRAALQKMEEESGLSDDEVKGPFDVKVKAGGSIMEGISRCRPGGRILVQEGTFEEKVAVDKIVHLFGRGRATVIWPCGEGPVVTCRAVLCSLDGLTLRAAPPRGGGTSSSSSGQPAAGDSSWGGEAGSELALQQAVVHILSGCPVVRGCNVSHAAVAGGGSSSVGVLISGGSSPILRQCVVHSCRGAGGAGIVVIGEGRPGQAADRTMGLIESCELKGNTVGIVVRAGAEPSVQSCKLHDNSVAVAVAGEGTGGKLEGCLMWRNPRLGVQVAAHAAFAVAGCKIHGSQDGIGLFNAGQVSVANSILQENRNGITVWGPGNAMITGNTVSLSSAAGVHLAWQARPTLTGNTLVENGFGVLVRRGAASPPHAGVNNTFQARCECLCCAHSVAW